MKLLLALELPPSPDFLAINSLPFYHYESSFMDMNQMNELGDVLSLLDETS